MAITKTKFMNLIRCPKVASFMKMEEYQASMNYEEYHKEELLEEEKEMDWEVKEIDVLLPYYNRVELEAGRIAKKYFDGSFLYAKDTKNQKRFTCYKRDIPYLCYVDIYNVGEIDRIIEVKATTSNGYLSLGKKEKGKLIEPIFQKGEDGIYHLLEDFEKPIESYMDKDLYEREREKLIGRFSNLGHYIYDLAFQRWIIEQTEKKERRYYLAVLNHAYEYDGTLKNGEPFYDTDSNGEELIVYFDFTNLTYELQDLIKKDQEKVERWIFNQEIPYCPIGPYCEKGKRTECSYADICFKKIPEKNSVFSYLDSQHGFLLGDKKVSVYDLVSFGLVSIPQVPNSSLTRWKNIVQKEVVTTHKPYIDFKKLKKGFNQIKYPIYHLDFETFPCPLPRLKGESPYTQSVFQFSLHIERRPGVCDKEKDHYGYLAPDLKDHRLDLVKSLIQLIDLKDCGTILVYNDTFEKSRLKELAHLYPEYQESLLQMREKIFDLMNLIKGNTKFYEQLGFDKETSKQFVFYDEKMNGSFSIKKVLPVFSKLTYEGMEVANGVDASSTYALFDSFDDETYKRKYQKMIEYCKQDTWAMVEILKGLRKLEKEGSL